MSPIAIKLETAANISTGPGSIGPLQLPIPAARLNLWDTVPYSLRADLLAVDDADLPALSTGELRREMPAGSSDTPLAGSFPKLHSK
jgi:hypothetical protein